MCIRDRYNTHKKRSFGKVAGTFCVKINWEKIWGCFIQSALLNEPEAQTMRMMKWRFGNVNYKRMEGVRRFIRIISANNVCEEGVKWKFRRHLNHVHGIQCMNRWKVKPGVDTIGHGVVPMTCYTAWYHMVIMIVAIVWSQFNMKLIWVFTLWLLISIQHNRVNLQIHQS